MQEVRLPFQLSCMSRPNCREELHWYRDRYGILAIVGFVPNGPVSGCMAQVRCHYHQRAVLQTMVGKKR